MSCLQTSWSSNKDLGQHALDMSSCLTTRRMVQWLRLKPTCLRTWIQVPLLVACKTHYTLVTGCSSSLSVIVIRNLIPKAVKVLLRSRLDRKVIQITPL